MCIRRHWCITLFAILFCLACNTDSALAAAEDWRPLDPEHLAMKSPTIEKDADAEAIFWEVRVNDEDLDTVLNHYIRIKIFTERGKEAHGKVDLTYAGSTRLRDIAGRTIKPDGTIIELKKDAIFDRAIVKAGNLKLNAKSFAMPGVEPGAVIEYRWREVRKFNLYMRFYIQRDFPIRSVKYSLKPYSFGDMGMRSMILHAPASPFIKEKDGFYSVTFTNVPAFREEPRMPPEDQVRAWMLVYYSRRNEKESPQEYWKNFGKKIYEVTKGFIKINDDIRRAATEAIGDATAPEAKLQRLFDYCRAKVKNVYDDASGFTDADRDKIKENKNPADTLKRGTGTGEDISLLFAALAAAAGFDARLALLSDRSDFFFDPNLPDGYFLRSVNVAARVGEEWRFFDPSAAYVPYGMLRWQEEGQQALITDPKEPVFVQTPLSPPAKSQQKRIAKLRLSDDGTLEGDVRVEYTGHLAADKKEYNDDDSQDQREQTLRDGLKEQMSTAEISGVRIENVTEPVKPFVCSYQVRVPGYAQRTGKRLFFKPAFFQYGVGPLFSAGERKHSVYFHYPWSEDDHVEIELPAGFALDNAESPAPFSLGQTGKYEVTLGVTRDKRTMVYKRHFEFNGLVFPVNSYPQLKKVFDILHEQDNHTVSLKQEAGEK